MDTTISTPFLLFANEFFDALPVHIFERDTLYWREIVVDYDKSSKKFRLMKSPASSVAAKLIPPKFQQSNHIELSFESGIVMLEMAKKLAKHRGSCLVVDYGHDSYSHSGDSFRAFKSHKQVDPLETPGEADLTVDVNFAYLRHVLANEWYVIFWSVI